MNASIAEKSSRYVLFLFISINLLNYIDRQVLYAVFPLVQAEFGLTDVALGFLGSAFMICYMVSAPALGWIGDRLNRVKIASLGLALWSLSTSFASFATSFRSLFLARMAVGIGEASFGTVSPGLLSDYFPKERRGWILSCFYMAIPVGSALGYILGGFIGQEFGWKMVFLVAGIPGLLLVFPLWLLKEPGRGGSSKLYTEIKEIGTDYVSLIKSRSFITNTFTMAAMTFAMGGMAQWVPTFLNRIHGLDLATGNMYFGAVTVLAGIAGTMAGGWLGDRLQRKSAKGYLIISGWGFFIGAPIAAYALMTPSVIACLVAMLFAEFFLFLNTGPLNAVIINVTYPSVRAMAFAVNIFFIHALGDAISPVILGWFSDLWGLRNALLITPFAILMAAFLCFLCRCFIEQDTARAEGLPL